MHSTRPCRYPERIPRHKNPISQDIQGMRFCGIRTRSRFSRGPALSRDSQIISRNAKVFVREGKRLYIAAVNWISRWFRGRFLSAELRYYLSKRNTIRVSMHSNEYSSRPLDRFISNQRLPLRRYQRFPLRRWRRVGKTRSSLYVAMWKSLKEKRKSRRKREISNYAGSLVASRNVWCPGKSRGDNSHGEIEFYADINSNDTLSLITSPRANYFYYCYFTSITWVRHKVEEDEGEYE